MESLLAGGIVLVLIIVAWWVYTHSKKCNPACVAPQVCTAGVCVTPGPPTCSPACADSQVCTPGGCVTPGPPTCTPPAFTEWSKGSKPPAGSSPACSADSTYGGVNYTTSWATGTFSIPLPTDGAKTETACGDACKNLPGCKGWHWNSAGGGCRLFPLVPTLNYNKDTTYHQIR